MSQLFEPLSLRGVTLRNRIGVSPMCQYSAIDGKATDWHLVHLGSRAAGGAGLVMVEASGVEARGRISPQDMGIWGEEHIEPLARITRFIHEQGSVSAIQLAHAGRKASTKRPWDGHGLVRPDEGGWIPVAPSPIPFNADYPIPIALSRSDIREVVAAFRAAAQRADRAGFDLVEIHGAHGYLLHSFYSPIANQRTDEYGGSFENRIRLPLEVTRAIREVWPDHKPLTFRITGKDWLDGGWTTDDAVALARRLKSEGVDLIDCSSGAIAPGESIKVGPGYQVPFAEAIRHGAEIPTAAVGLITQPAQANTILQEGRADLIFMAREFLRDPYWPLHAARTLGQPDAVPVPPQYQRSF